MKRAIMSHSKINNFDVERGMPANTSSHSAAGILIDHGVEIESFNETFNDVKLAYQTFLMLTVHYHF